eukprot:525988_1
MSNELLMIELKVDLELLQEDTELQQINDIDIEDIFSSSEGDYKLFELTTNDILTDENESIWNSYFDKIATKQHQYMNESQHILSEMKQTCADALKTCNINTTTPIPYPQKTEHKVIITPLSPEINTNSSQIQEEIITINPCIPCHITESPNKHRSKSTSSTYSNDNLENIFEYQDNSLTKQDTTKIPTISVPSPTLNVIDNISSNIFDYDTELQKLEHELKEETEAHEQELQTNSTVKWSTLLHESKELYDEYVQTTQNIKRDKEKLILTQNFCVWKVEWERNKREKLRLMKLTKEMNNVILKLMNKTIIRFETKEHRLNLWNNLIIKYKHKNIIDKIHSNSLWKVNVIEYIIFHYKQNYQSIIKHRNYLKTNCLPFIFERAQYYQQRRLCVKKISIWYKQQINKRNMNHILHGICKLTVFRRNYIENPLKELVLISWIKYIKCRKYAIECFMKKINKNKMYQTLCYIRNKTKLKILKRKMVTFRKCKNERINYLILQKHKKTNATIMIQSYFRMFYVRSIMNDIKIKLSSINDMFSTQIQTEQEFYEFKELDENEYIFDQSIIDFDLQPLSNPPTPRLSVQIDDKSLETESNSEFESNDQNTTSSSTCEEESESEQHTESEEESESEQHTESEEENESEEKTEVLNNNIKKPQNKKNDELESWSFDNESVAKSWLKRKKKFKRKKMTQNAKTRLHRFSRTKQKSHSFGGTARFNTKQKKHSDKKQKPKFVKFGCP